jgi:hypothetical protein
MLSNHRKKFAGKFEFEIPSNFERRNPLSIVELHYETKASMNKYQQGALRWKREMWGGGIYFVLNWGTWVLCAHQSLTYLCSKKPFPTKRYFCSASTRFRGAANPDCGSGSGDSFIKFLENCLSRLD